MENNNETKQEQEIDLLELYQVVKKKIAAVLISCILFGVIGFAVSAFFITPKYQASVNLIVNARVDSSNNNVTNDNLNSAQRLVDTYAVIIKSNRVLEQVIGELQLDMTFEELDDCVTVSSVNDTPVMQITVEDTDPNRAYLIADSISRIAPGIIVDAVEAGSCKLVNNVYSTPRPVSPNIPRNTIIAAVIGIVLSIGWIIVQHLMDNTFHSELDLRNELDLPVLGVIPSVESCRESEEKARRATK